MRRYLDPLGDRGACDSVASSILEADVGMCLTAGQSTPVRRSAGSTRKELFGFHVPLTTQMRDPSITDLHGLSLSIHIYVYIHVYIHTHIPTYAYVYTNVYVSLNINKYDK